MLFAAPLGAATMYILHIHAVLLPLTNIYFQQIWSEIAGSGRLVIARIQKFRWGVLHVDSNQGFQRRCQRSNSSLLDRFPCQEQGHQCQVLE